MNMNKRITLGILNILMGGMTLYYFIQWISNSSINHPILGALFFLLAAILPLFGGILTLLKKHWAWFIVGICAFLAWWIFWLIGMFEWLSTI